MIALESSPFHCYFSLIEDGKGRSKGRIYRRLHVSAEHNIIESSPSVRASSQFSIGERLGRREEKPKSWLGRLQNLFTFRLRLGERYLSKLFILEFGWIIISSRKVRTEKRGREIWGAYPRVSFTSREEACLQQTRTQSLFTCFRSECVMERAKRAGSDGKRLFFLRLFPSLPARFAQNKQIATGYESVLAGYRNPHQINVHIKTDCYAILSAIQ